MSDHEYIQDSINMVVVSARADLLGVAPDTC